jgi:hypothetical protein
MYIWNIFKLFGHELANTSSGVLAQLLIMIGVDDVFAALAVAASPSG